VPSRSTRRAAATARESSYPLSSVLELVAAGDIGPVIHDRFDLAEAKAAHRAILSESFIGKLVVTP